MESKASLYLPAVFRSVQGFDVMDLKEWGIRRYLGVFGSFGSASLSISPEIALEVA